MKETGDREARILDFRTYVAYFRGSL